MILLDVGFLVLYLPDLRERRFRERQIGPLCKKIRKSETNRALVLGKGVI